MKVLEFKRTKDSEIRRIVKKLQSVLSEDILSLSDYEERRTQVRKLLEEVENLDQNFLDND
jgi:hypothetical protein